MIEGLRKLHRHSWPIVGLLVLGAPAVATAHGAHPEVGPLAHPLAHASFFIAAACIAVPALVHLGRRAWKERS